MTKAIMSPLLRKILSDKKTAAELTAAIAKISRENKTEACAIIGNSVYTVKLGNPIRVREYRKK